MHCLSCALACLACSIHGRRVSPSNRRSDGRLDQPLLPSVADLDSDSWEENRNDGFGALQNLAFFLLQPSSADAFSLIASTGTKLTGQRVAATRSAQHPAAMSMDSVETGKVQGPVLRPSLPSEPTQFDTACVANPVVLPPSVTGTGKWQCYYYGNAGTWAGGTKGFLPTGWTGLAESDDGVHWSKVIGKEEGGSILSPTGNPDDWDGIHLGVGDVVRVNDNELHMYYFGGSGEKISFGGAGPPPAAGLRMRIGRARSTDGGKTWERLGMVLDFNEEEGLFASWPRIMIPDAGEGGDGKPWKMLYHAFNGTRWAAFGATSVDQGETWVRDGLLLGPGEDSSWDGMGVGTRAVARMKTGEWVMAYEAVAGQGGPMGGKHRIGVAWLKDGEWEKDSELTDAPGGPIFDPGVSPLQSWTEQVIGTPYLVPMDDGSLRMYFCSKRNQDMSMHIGLVESPSGALSPSSWRPVSPSSTVAS